MLRKLCSPLEVLEELDRVGWRCRVARDAAEPLECFWCSFSKDIEYRIWKLTLVAMLEHEADALASRAILGDIFVSFQSIASKVA